MSQSTTQNFFRSQATEHLFEYNTTETLEVIIKKGIWATFKNEAEIHEITAASARNRISDAILRASLMEVEYDDESEEPTDAEFKAALLDKKHEFAIVRLDHQMMGGILVMFEEAENTLGEMKDVFPGKLRWLDELQMMWDRIPEAELEKSLEDADYAEAYTKWMNEEW